MHVQDTLKDTLTTWRLAWPIALSQLATTGSAFINTVMSGHVSDGDLAAVSVGSSIWVTLTLTILGYSLATSPMVAHKMGENDAKSVPSLVQQALIQACLLTVIAFVVARLLSPIFPHIGLEPAIASKAAAFLDAVCWGLPAFAFFRVLYSYSAALKYTKPMMVTALFSMALNVPLNWMFIYGHLGFPAMGAVGCGWATAICMWVNFILLASWILMKDHYQATHPFRAWQGWNLATHKQLFKLGLPIGIMFLVEVSAFSFIALVIARLGTVSVAAHQIALNFSSLTFMIPMAIGTALTIRVGHEAGAKNFDAARAIGKNGIQLGLFIAILTGGLMIFGSSQIVGWYTKDAAVIALASNLIVLAGIFQFSDITQVVSAGALRGYKITRLPMIIHMTAFWAIGMPLGYLLTFGAGSFDGMGVRGYWFALIIALTLTAVALLFLFHRASKSKIPLTPDEDSITMDEMVL